MDTTPLKATAMRLLDDATLAAIGDGITEGDPAFLAYKSATSEAALGVTYPATVAKLREPKTAAEQHRARNKKYRDNKAGKGDAAEEKSAGKRNRRSPEALFDVDQKIKAHLVGLNGGEGEGVEKIGKALGLDTKALSPRLRRLVGHTDMVGGALYAFSMNGQKRAAKYVAQPVPADTPQPTA